MPTDIMFVDLKNIDDEMDNDKQRDLFSVVV